MLIFSFFFIYLFFSVIKRKLVTHVFPLAIFSSIFVATSFFDIKKTRLNKLILTFLTGVCFFLNFFPFYKTDLHKFLYSNYFHIREGNIFFDGFSHYKFENVFTHNFGDNRKEFSNISGDLLSYFEEIKNLGEKRKIFFRFHPQSDAPFFTGIQFFLYQNLYNDNFMELFFIEDFDDKLFQNKKAFIISSQLPQGKNIKVVKIFRLEGIDYYLLES